MKLSDITTRPITYVCKILIAIWKENQIPYGIDIRPCHCCRVIVLERLTSSDDELPVEGFWNFRRLYFSLSLAIVSRGYFHVSVVEASNLLNAFYAGVEQFLPFLSPNLACFNKSRTDKKTGWGRGWGEGGWQGLRLRLISIRPQQHKDSTLCYIHCLRYHTRELRSFTLL